MKITMRVEYTEDELKHMYLKNTMHEITTDTTWDANIYAYHNLYLNFLQFLTFHPDEELVEVLMSGEEW